MNETSLESLVLTVLVVWHAFSPKRADKTPDTPRILREIDIPQKVVMQVGHMVGRKALQESLRLGYHLKFGIGRR